MPPSSLDEFQPEIAAFCERNGIERLEIFGSYVTGELRPESDLDFLVTFRSGVNPGWDFVTLAEDLEAIVGCKIDLLTRPSVERDENWIRRKAILQAARTIYAA